MTSSGAWHRRLGLLPWAAPAMAFVVAFAFYPILSSFVVALFRYRLTDPTRARIFVGLENYLKAFADQQFLATILNTLTFVGLAVGTEMVLGLAIAVLLDQEVPGMRLVRSLILAPLTLAPIVVALIWKALYNPDFGAISYYLRAIGIDIGRGLAGEPSTALLSLVVIDVWQWTPLIAVTLLAGLRSQRVDLLEAAQLDGASAWQRFRHISLPLLKPILFVALLLRTTEVFKVFDSVFIITGGGPGTATEVINFYIFKVGLTFFDMGYASALSTLLLLLMSGVIALYFWAAQEKDP